MRNAMTWTLVVCLLLMLVGCGSPTAPEADPTRAEEEAGSSEGVTPGEEDESTGNDVDETGILSSFHEIREMRDIIRAFSLLEFSFSDHENEITVTYELVGPANVGDTSADHVTLTIGGDEKSELDFWMDEDGNTLRLVLDGEDTGALGPVMADMLLVIVVMPFALYASDWEDAFVQSEGFRRQGWTVASRDQSTRDLGDGNVTVHQYHFHYTAAGQQLDYRFEIAEISGYSMFVGWEVELGSEQKTTFRVDRVVPR